MQSKSQEGCNRGNSSETTFILKERSASTTILDKIVMKLTSKMTLTFFLNIYLLLEGEKLSCIWVFLKRLDSNKNMGKKLRKEKKVFLVFTGYFCYISMFFLQIFCTVYENTI